MLELNVPQIDLTAAEDGNWIPYEDGIEFLIARSGNDAYRKAFARIYKANKMSIDRGTISDEKSDDLMNSVLSKHILLGWRGLNNGDEPLEYSQETAYEILSDKRYAELRDWIREVSGAAENFRSEDRKK